MTAGVDAVRALTFDVFGTTVDWRSGVIAEFRRMAASRGATANWELAADMWRSLYMPSMNRVRRGEIPWTNFDDLHRMSLDPGARRACGKRFRQRSSR